MWMGAPVTLETIVRRAISHLKRRTLHPSQPGGAMARVIRFHYPLSFRPASKPRPAQGTRGKLIQFPPVAYRPSRALNYRVVLSPVQQLGGTKLGLLRMPGR